MDRRFRRRHGSATGFRPRSTRRRKDGLRGDYAPKALSCKKGDSAAAQTGVHSEPLRQALPTSCVEPDWPEMRCV